MDSILAIAMLLTGIWILHATIQCRKYARISTPLMLPQNKEEKQLRNPAAFRHYLCPRAAFLGATSIACGTLVLILYAAAGALGAMFVLVTEIMLLAFYFAVWFYYIYSVSKAWKRYQ